MSYPYWLTICHCSVKGGLFFQRQVKEKLHLSTLVRHSKQCLFTNSLLLSRNKVWLIAFASCVCEVALHNHLNCLQIDTRLPIVYQSSLLTTGKIHVCNLVVAPVFWGEMDDKMRWLLISKVIQRTIGTDYKIQVHRNQQTSIENAAYVWKNYRH